MWSLIAKLSNCNTQQFEWSAPSVHHNARSSMLLLIGLAAAKPITNGKTLSATREDFDDNVKAMACPNARWQQCDGEGFTGERCCSGSLSCVFDNQWWSMCDESKSPPAPPSPPLCDPPPEKCTNIPKIDAILQASDIGCKIGLTNRNHLYSWRGFCDAMVAYNEGSGKKLFLGNSTAQGLVNIASLLAQCMWETGGVVPFSTCDESNYRGWKTASCTQRSDGARYDALNEQPWACKVDKQMRMTAVTYVSSYAKGPLKCEPGTVTEGCCWWGRGAIQTTGPNNYGLLQREVISKIPALSSIDLCTNPEAVCENEQTKYLGAFFFWANDIQGAIWPAQKDRFDHSLKKYVDLGFDRKDATYDGADFAEGCGNVVNNGLWTAKAHGSDGRVAYFDKIIGEFKEAGMRADV